MMINRLRDLATRLYHTPANSVPSERAFSVQNILHTKARNRLKVERTARLIFLYINTRSLNTANPIQRAKGFESWLSLTEDDAQGQAQEMEIEQEYEPTGEEAEEIYIPGAATITRADHLLGRRRRDEDEIPALPAPALRQPTPLQLAPLRIEAPAILPPIPAPYPHPEQPAFAPRPADTPRVYEQSVYHNQPVPLSSAPADVLLRRNESVQGIESFPGQE